MVKKNFILLLFFYNLLYANTITIDKNTNNLNITPNIKIYIDDTKTKSFEDIKKMQNKFKKHNKSFLDFGYIVASGVWVKVEFQNNTNQNIKKVLEYTDGLVSEYFLYSKDKNLEQKQGILVRPPTIKNLHHYFTINIPPNTKKEYFIYLSTQYSSTHGMFKIWNSADFFEKENQHMLIMTSFFSMLIILTIYNLFLYIFSKDKVYIYYVFHLFIITLHYSIISAYFYTFMEPDTRKYFENELFSMFIINFTGISSILFTKKFLDTKQYKAIDIGLDIFLYIMLIGIVFFTISNNFTLLELDIDILYLLFLYLLFIGWYALFKKNFNARYYVIGWGMILSSSLMIVLHYLGVYPFKYEFPYVIEALFLGEAILFSIALAHKLEILQDNLILQQKKEQQKLKKEVSLKTKDLSNALEMKDYLLKELHHRVKNNMQIIISIIRLQYRRLDEKIYKEKFIEMENRIEAISKVHNLLYSNSTIDNFTTQSYFKTLVKNIQNSFDEKFDIDLTINCDYKFNADHAIYLGLIINELVYNSFKYAFKNKKGKIHIDLKELDNKHILIVQDNGIGFKDENKPNSLGLRIIKTLVKEQLNGSIKISSIDGTKVEIEF